MDNHIERGTAIDNDRCIDATQIEEGRARHDQIVISDITESKLEVMAIATEHLIVRLLKRDDIIGIVDIEVLHDVIFNLGPVELSLPQTIHILTEVLHDIGIGLFAWHHEE